jgi:hypothetical protein
VFVVSAKLPKEKTALAIFHGGRGRRCRGMAVSNAPADFMSGEREQGSHKGGYSFGHVKIPFPFLLSVFVLPFVFGE